MARSAKQPTIDVHGQVEAIKDDLGQLREDMGSLMRELVAAGKLEAGEARTRVEAVFKDRIDRIQRAASDVTDRVREHGKDAIDTIENHAREKPLQTIAIALGVGVLLGALLRR